MSADLVAVLVTPEDGDLIGLLAPFRPNGSPPIVSITDHGTWHAAVGPPYSRALPLLWDGAFVPEGWDRARRILWTHTALRMPEALREGLTDFGVVVHDIPLVHRCEWMAVELVRYGLACRVVRLARVDGQLVEVQP